jgi:hypothetical protein
MTEADRSTLSADWRCLCVWLIQAQQSPDALAIAKIHQIEFDLPYFGSLVAALVEVPMMARLCPGQPFWRAGLNVSEPSVDASLPPKPCVGPTEQYGAIFFVRVVHFSRSLTET